MAAVGTRSLGSYYRLEERIGSGAMGQVWRAIDLRTQDVVAAKLLRDDLTSDPQLVGRFVQERSILLGLVHPHVVVVRDLVVDGGELGIVMDLVDGVDLRRYLDERATLSPAEAVRIAVDVLDALTAAHERGVLHRDVKPDNVLLDRSTPPVVRLGDFGIARIAQETTVRATGVLGTAEYIAPEVFSDEEISAATDVYGAGVLLYELLAGRTPFAGSGGDYAVAFRHVTTDVPVITGLPRELADLLQEMLAKSPQARPSAASARNSLRRLAPGLAGLAALPAQTQPLWTDDGDATSAVGVRSGRDAVPADPQKTSIKGERLKPPPMLGPVADAPGRAALVPAADGNESTAGTMLRGLRPARPDVDVPDAVSVQAAAASRWRKILLVLGAVLALAAIVGAVFYLTSSGKSAHPKSKATQDTAITAQAPVDQGGLIGLSITRSASFDPQQKVLTVTIGYASTHATLPGPFFESVPATAAGGSCPTPAWIGASVVRDSTLGVDAGSCGWQITPASPVGSASPSQVSFQVPFVPTGSGGAAAAVATYIQGEATTTDTALTGLTSGPAYPAQRLSMVQVSVDGGVSLGKSINLVAYPVWGQSGQADTLDPLYTTSTPGGSALAKQLGGLTGPFSDSCTQIGVTHGVPFANSPATGCTLSVSVGGQQATSDSFDINVRGG